MNATRLVEALGKALDFEESMLTEIGQADPAYFEEARELLLKGLRDWNEDQKIPVCLACGSPLVDWIETASECGWRCQKCGAVEDRTGDGRRAAA
jgi:hypothetical protein